MGTDDFGPRAIAGRTTTVRTRTRTVSATAGDTDDDNDGILDAPDLSPLDPDVCGIPTATAATTVPIGTDGFGPRADTTLPGNDGTDTDSDGAAATPGTRTTTTTAIPDGSGSVSPLDPDALRGFSDGDTLRRLCDRHGQLRSAERQRPFRTTTARTRTATVSCDAGDADDDNDGVLDGPDPAALDPDVCGDGDGDTCDDCAIGTDDFGTQSDSLPDNDGPDTDSDGQCDAGDTDDDNDGILDVPGSGGARPRCLWRLGRHLRRLCRRTDNFGTQSDSDTDRIRTGGYRGHGRTVPDVSTRTPTRMAIPATIAATRCPTRTTTTTRCDNDTRTPPMTRR